MNRYYGTFPFKGEYFFIDFTSDQLANAAINHNDSVMGYVYDDKSRYFEEEFYCKGEKFCVTFSYHSTLKVNVFACEDECGSEELVEKDIPWLLLKIEDGEGNVVYNLTDDI